MSLSKKEKIFDIHCLNLQPVAEEVMDYFRKKDFEVVGQEKITGDWHISIHKGGIFKTIVGMKTSLNIEINQSISGVEAKVSVGIFGEQVIPSAISLLIFWPVLITQIWGLIEQAKLDEEVMKVIEQSLKSHEISDNQMFCVNCGKPIPIFSKFCLECGAEVIERL